LTEGGLRIGVVGVPGGWSTEALADALEARTGYRLVVDMAEVSLDLAARSLRWRDVDLTGLDGVVLKKVGDVYGPDMLDRLELLRWLEESGVRVFSPARNVVRLVDRLSCTVTLSSAGIAVPPTVITEDLRVAETAIQDYGAAVLKPLYSTKARGMCVVEGGDRVRVRRTLEEFRAAGNAVFYIQKRLVVPDRDLGVVFLGGEYVGTYARVAGEGTWNTTIRAGGRYAAANPSVQVVELARAAQAPFGLDFTSVDVVECSEGPMVFEVSAFGGFRGLRDGLGNDAAAMYADYVMEQLDRA
jgi:tetrahydromethanopterin:alpha-L-glutamate ligase